MAASAARAGRTGLAEDGDWLATIRLALLPRFAAEVVELDADQAVGGLYRVCEVASCVWMARVRGLCATHHDRWRRAGRPTMSAFHADPGRSLGPERIHLGGLDQPLRAEVGLALQELAFRAPRPHRQVAPSLVQRLLDALERHDAPSLLTTDGTWVEDLPAPVRRIHAVLRRAVEDHLVPPTPTAEFERDVWRLGVMGLAGRTGANGFLRFDRIRQPWLRSLVKRFMRWRIATDRSYHQLSRDITALQRLADALTARAGPGATVVDFTRETIEVYLAVLVRLGLREASRCYDISLVSVFLSTVRLQGWQPDLPPSAGVFPGDSPRRPAALPQALPEFVRAQVENPENLAQLGQPHRLMMQILIGTGLRLTDAYRLGVDCLVRDAHGDPYLRYRNHKMNREAIVPINDDLATAIRHQLRLVAEQTPRAVLLAPGVGSRDGRRPWSSGAAAARIGAWQETIGLHDEHGRPFRFTAHQLRHTYGTRMINADVPQEVVRRLLDHDSPETTARYARLSDQTIRRHWERARKVDIHGQPVTLERGSPLSDAAWMKENLGRATMALPNGYCGLPMQQSCPHANACLTCPVFITTPDFLTEHLAHLRAANRLIGEAEANGHTRLAEMNQQVATNLGNIIDALQAPADHDPRDDTSDDTGTHDAS